MNWSAATLWWIAAGLAVAVEIATGTFYLLMLALGMAAAALAAHAGFGLATQLTTAALVGGGGTALWHLRRARQPRSEPARSNRDVNLDVGERVFVAGWGEDRSAKVQYRGSEWNARLEPGHAPQPGEHRVSAVEGNWLVLTPAAAFVAITDPNSEAVPQRR